MAAWCCMGYVLGRKPEHETVRFSVWNGCSRRWKLPRLCGGCGWGRFVVFFFCRNVTAAWSCFGCACVCVVIGCFGICACRSHWNGCMTLVIWCSGVVLCVDRCRFASWCCEPHCHGCMMLHGLCFGEEAGARNLVFFRVKWLQATMKGTSCVRRLRLGSVCRFFLPQCNRGLKLLWVCLCVRSYRVFWNLRLQIALEWLHDSCHLVFWCCSVRVASHKARTHRPGWRTVHASSFVVVLGSDSWKLRWHMRRDEMRRAKLG